MSAPSPLSGVSDKQKTLKMNKIVQISVFSKHIQKLTYFIPMFRFILTGFCMIATKNAKRLNINLEMG